MIAAVYCRVSTEEQGTNGTSLDSQLAACLKKANDLGYEVPDDLIFKESYSGLSLDRPLFNILRYKAKKGEFEAVVAYGPDRLSRKGEDILTVVAEFKYSGIKLHCVQREFEDSFTGKMIAFVMGWASELEASQIKERTMRGKRVLAGKGQLPQGTGIGFYGYGWDKVNKKRIPIEFEVRVVNRVFNMIASGDSKFKAAKALNESGIPSKSGGKWHPITIDRMITNTAYIGKSYFGKVRRNGKRFEDVPEEEWIMMPDTTPAIISDDLFKQANKALALSKELHHGRPKHDYLLTGHVRCSICGNHMVGASLNHTYLYYRCRGAYATSIRGAICNAGYIRADQMEDMAWNKVKEVLENPKLILTELKKRAEANKSGNGRIEKEMARIQKRMSTCESQQQRLLTLFGNGGIDESAIVDKLSQLKTEKQQFEDQVNRLSKSVEQRIDINTAKTEIERYCQTVKANLNKCTLQDRKKALNALDVQIEAIPEKIKIRIAVPLEFITIEQTWA